MQIGHVSVTNVRAVKGAELDLGPVTAFVGDNGQGKTSLLLGLLFALCGTADDAASLVRRGEEHAKVVADTRMVTFSRGAKRLFLQGSPVTFGDFIRSGSFVSFFPEDLLTLSLEPRRRRRWLDMLLCKRDSEYLVQLSRYARVLKQRNSLLKSGVVSESLEIFTEEAATLQASLHAARSALLQKLMPHVEEGYRLLSGGEVVITGQIAGMGDEHLTAEGCREALERALPDDLRLRETTFGPHRSDIALHLSGTPIRQASRGEARTLALALTIAEARMLKEAGEVPVVLLDDVFSELDRGRQAQLARAFPGSQLVLTTTKPEHLEVFPEALTYRITEGAAERV